MSSSKQVPVGIGVMIKRGNNVLMGHRKARKEDTSSWTFPGGFLDYGESLKEGAEREVGEETGLIVNELELIGVVDDFDGAAGEHFVTINFLCEDFSGEPEVKEPDKFSEWRWFSLDDLPEHIFPPAKGTIICFKSDKQYL